MKSCPNCGYPVATELTVCPHCGAELSGVWPPPPDGFVSPVFPGLPRLLTKIAWLDFLLGASMQYLTHLATAQALVRWAGLLTPSRDDLGNYLAPGFFDLTEGFWAVVFGLALYYGLRRFYPTIARGSGYMTLAMLTVLLGALFICRPLLY